MLQWLRRLHRNVLGTSCQSEEYQLLKVGHILCFVTVSAAALAYTLAGLTNWHDRCGVVFMGAGDMAS